MSQPTLKLSVAKASSGSVLLIHEEHQADGLISPLIDAGYRVVLAQSTKLGLEEAMKGAFDVVLCDGDIPGESAADALSIIQAYEKDLPLVLLGHQVKPDTALDAVTLLDRLEKPITSASLLRVVDRAVELTRDLRGMLDVRLEKKETTAFTTRVTAPAMSSPVVSMTRAKEVAPVANPTSKLERACASLRVELEPIFDVDRVQVIGHEARVVSDEPALAVNPALIASAGVEILRKRTRELAAKAFLAAKSPRLFVDVCPADLLDPDLYAPEAPLSQIAERVVLQLRGGTGLPIVDLGARISVLRFLGFRIAVADLDGGARLAFLGDVSPEYVKLDPSLTRNIDASRETGRRRVVEGLLAMCRLLGATPVAEGVVTAGERTTLAQLGCNLVQGVAKKPVAAAPPSKFRRPSRRSIRPMAMARAGRG
jgi:EAL domain-containing protein (putative c-di-GMP-specific phosphodiesterase class I)/CheY-like chemotaxis protein